MRDILGPGTILGYCTNVHAGADIGETLRSLIQCTHIKNQVSPKDKMGLGLWISKRSAMHLFEELCVQKNFRFRDGFNEHGVIPFTMNGFPFGDFHAEIVKHHVYEPDWSHEDRWGYTILLASIHAALLGDQTHVERSISTLPVGWQGSPHPPIDLAAAADRLLNITSMLSNWHAETGLIIHIDLEPEPGCILQRSGDVVKFFNSHLLPRISHHQITEEQVLRHLRVCHDICHAAIMFEDQAEMFARYRAAGIRIGKVQISNAIRADFRDVPAEARHDMLAQLEQFAEDRYLHQTMVRTGDDLRFIEDLPRALNEYQGTASNLGDEWRVHFHVPVYLEAFGLLKTTRDYIIECMQLLKNSEVKHWEVETYAWNVLPKELQVPNLADGIAKELLWVKEQAANIK